MENNKVAAQHHQTFDGIRHTDEQGNEYWLARQLADVLEYSQYRHFLPVIERAKEASRNSGQPVDDHFEDVLTMVEIGSGGARSREVREMFRQIREAIEECGLIAEEALENASL